MAEEFNYKIYDAVNLSQSQAYVFMGKAGVSGVNGSQKTFFPNLAEQNNCSTTFIFASLVGSRNVEVTPAKLDDPYVYIDSRWYQFIDATKNTNVISANNMISKIQEYRDETKIKLTMNNIVTDGSIIFENGSQTITEGSSSRDIYSYNDPNYADIVLRTHRYDCENICGPAGLFAGRKGIPGKSDVIFVFKNILEGKCIKIDEDETSITINYDVDNPSCNPLTYSPDTSIIPLSSANTICSSFNFSQEWKFVSDPSIDALCD